VQLEPPGSPLGMARGAVPQAGDFVRVSGLRDGSGSIQATRVEKVPPRASVSLTAPLDYQSGNVGLVGTLNVVGVQAAPSGQEIAMTGVLKNGVLAVRQTRIAPSLDFVTKPERLVLQGLVRPSPKAGLDLGYVRLDAPAGDTAKPGDWVRVEVQARQDGRLETLRLDTFRPPERERHEPTVKRHAERQDAVESTRTGERAEQVERAGRSEMPEKVEKVEKPEKPEKVEKIEKPEKPEKPEKIEKIEKPEKVEKVEKVERPERVERHDD
jgi:hypothetical protein